MSEGIHAVFKGMPLYWGRGYLGRALAVMESAAAQDVKLPKDAVRKRIQWISVFIKHTHTLHDNKKVITMKHFNSSSPLFC